jgi:hypothetical protein
VASRHRLCWWITAGRHGDSEEERMSWEQICRISSTSSSQELSKHQKSGNGEGSRTRLDPGAEWPVRRCFQGVVFVRTTGLLVKVHSKGNCKSFLVSDQQQDKDIKLEEKSRNLFIYLYSFIILGSIGVWTQIVTLCWVGAVSLEPYPQRTLFFP